MAPRSSQKRLKHKPRAQRGQIIPNSPPLSSKAVPPENQQEPEEFKRAVSQIVNEENMPTKTALMSKAEVVERSRIGSINNKESSGGVQSHLKEMGPLLNSKYSMHDRSFSKQSDTMVI